ncbi:MAG TPA: MASE1 domain-containing protein [Myxococcales bacterium]|nr:MASE1 domain-containing protein [Myxococcales bacterium]
MVRSPSAREVAAAALLVAVAYYVGAKAGLLFRFPPSTPSVIWPPNSILTAALLLVAPRRWWIYLLAALPAHLAAELPQGWPVPLVLGLFVTNCSEALLAALLVRRFSDAPARLDTLRRVGAFILGAVLLAPLLSTFADAALVTATRGEPFWGVFQIRLFSNVLTELTVVPPILTVLSPRIVWSRCSSALRRLEAASLAISLLTTAFLVLARQGPLVRLSRTPLAFLLPFLLWAAVRFGPPGASLSFLATTLVAIWAGTHGRGPFQAGSPAENVLGVQVFLTMLALPILSLAAVIAERKRAEEALQERLRFEKLLARLSAAFVHLPSHQIDEAITTWLRNLGDFFKKERLALLRLSADQKRLTLSHSWAASGIEAGPPAAAGTASTPAAEKLLREESFVSGWSATLPLVANGKVIGGLSFDFAAGEPWPDELAQRLRLAGEVFANALARKEAEDALRASEVMKSAILGSLTSGVAVLDRGGRVIAVNESWTRFGSERQAGFAGVGVGAAYLEACRHTGRDCALRSAEALAGIEQVLGGTRQGFAFEYSSPAPNGERWFAVSVVPLNRSEGGAVVSHTDLTERKRAEVQAEQSRQELAHFTRVSTIGELTASLAHELRQPLTGILTNAQAARRFLDSVSPDLDELREALADIIADDRRAEEVIQRVRDLLRKGELRRTQLDLNEVIRSVTRLLGSDAVIRNVALALELAPTPVVVSGDRIQLEQVILNLLVNAIDATAEVTDGDRTIVVRSEANGDELVHVAVQDRGTGLREGVRERVFEPFFTTKPAGMGMGLSIAKSIIEAHGGVIWATNNPTRGATFHFSLPEPVSPAEARHQ